MKPNAIWQTSAKLVGAEIHVYDQLDSTNALALTLASDPTLAGCVILAKEQTAGRGQHGRTWQSRKADSVLLSALVFPSPEMQRPVLLTAWAAVSVCDTISELSGLTATIKWPNDVLLGDRKICGILIEQRGGTVAGIGLNIRQRQRFFDKANLPQAISLYVASGVEYSLRDVAEILCHHLDRHYRTLERGRLVGLEKRWRRGLGLLRRNNRRVLAECHQGDIAGTLRTLSFAVVEIERDDGSVCRLQPEAIRHLTPCP